MRTNHHRANLRRPSFRRGDRPVRRRLRRRCPVQSGFTGRKRNPLLARSYRKRTSQRGRPLHETVQRVARARSRLPPSPPDALLHGRHGNGRHAVRAGTGRRGHHAVLHLRLDRECRGSTRCRAGFCRYPARHAQHRRTPDRSGHHGEDQGHRRGSLRGCRLCHGRDHGHRGAARPLRVGGRRAGHRGAVQGPSARQHRAPCGRELSRNQEFRLGRRGCSADQ